jgi:threonine dehydrogenase-like Zn-dependent dehydrogenase
VNAPDTMAIPATCRAVAIVAGATEFVEGPVRRPGPGEVLVRVAACALCTWEIRTFSGAEPAGRPLLGGHELAGEVVEYGPGPVAVPPGGQVAVRRMGQCGACRGCRESRQCAYRALGVTENDRGFGPQGLGEYLTVPAGQVFPVAGEVPATQAALVEPLACVLRGVLQARLSFGDDVLVFGAGFMGMLHARLARLRGARVILAEPAEARRRLATSLGELVLDPATPEFPARVREITEGGPAATFVTGGGRDALAMATDLAADGGRVMVFASTHPPEVLSAEVNRVHHHEVAILGTVSQSAAEFHRAARLISHGSVDMAPLISETFPFNQIENALRAAALPVPYRVVITMDNV